MFVSVWLVVLRSKLDTITFLFLLCPPKMTTIQRKKGGKLYNKFALNGQAGLKHTEIDAYLLFQPSLLFFFLSSYFSFFFMLLPIQNSFFNVSTYILIFADCLINGIRNTDVHIVDAFCVQQKFNMDNHFSSIRLKKATHNDELM